MNEEIVFRCMDPGRNRDGDAGIVLCTGPDCPEYDQGWCIQIRETGGGPPCTGFL
ncbi:hypothetical protein [Methanoregula sp.]|uniref:hypothetical protein n=1 Tax=Methanoregula sp. TaxID=2052170 RepID=UPI003C7147C6